MYLLNNNRIYLTLSIPRQFFYDGSKLYMIQREDDITGEIHAVFCGVLINSI